MNSPYIKLEHIATRQPLAVEVNAKEYQWLAADVAFNSFGKDIDELTDMAFESMISRGVLDSDVWEQFFFEGLYARVDGRIKLITH